MERNRFLSTGASEGTRVSLPRLRDVEVNQASSINLVARWYANLIALMNRILVPQGSPDNLIRTDHTADKESRFKVVSFVIRSRFRSLTIPFDRINLSIYYQSFLFYPIQPRWKARLIVLSATWKIRGKTRIGAVSSYERWMVTRRRTISRGDHKGRVSDDVNNAGMLGTVGGRGNTRNDSRYRGFV